MTMFCYQCEQASKGTGCTLSSTCGKEENTALAQDLLTCEIIGLAQAMADTGVEEPSAIDDMVDGLFATVTNVNFSVASVATLADKLKNRREKLGGKERMKPEALFRGDENLVSLRSTLLFGLRGMAAYAHHARVLGKRKAEVDAWFIKGMAAVGREHSVEAWLSLLMELGGINLQCMAMLDEAHTQAYGKPTPTQGAAAH